MTDKVCSKCGAVSTYKEGQGPKGPWAGYFCTDRDNCKNVDWIKLKANEKPTPKLIIPAKANGTSTDMMRLAYRKDLMVALINTGIPDAVEKFGELWTIIEK